MRGATTRTLLLAGVIAGLCAAVALGAPVAGTTAPSISGHANYASTLTCHTGTWSSDAVSFDYTWTYSGGGPTIATGAKLRVPETVTGYAIVCVVTAHDAQGQTASATSAAVVPAAGLSTVRITRATVRHGTVTISGIAGPALALARGSNGRPTVVLDRRLTKNSVLQLAGPQIVTSRRGRFTIKAPDSRGRHTYLLRFDPYSGTGFSESEAKRTLRVR